MLTLEQLQKLKERNFSFLDTTHIQAAIEKAQIELKEQGIPGAELAKQYAAIIIAENDAPRLAIMHKVLEEANSVLEAEERAKDAAILAQDLLRQETDTVSDPEYMQ
jgi:hypothetical protein